VNAEPGLAMTPARKPAPERTVLHPVKPPLLSPALALLATLLALSALLGWALDIATLKQGLASSVAMNPATALCLALLGLEAIRMNALNAHAVLAKAGQLAILVVIAAGLSKLCDLIFGTSFAIDQTLFGAALNADSRYPSRMAPNTAACLALLGVAMQFMRGGTDSRVRNAQLLAALALLTGLLALAGNLFSARELAGLAQYIPMAFGTAIAVCFIAVSILSSSPQKGLLKFVNWQSIQTRVTLASTAIFLTGVWALTIHSSAVLHDATERQLSTQQFSTVSMLAAEIERELHDRSRTLETTAQKITPAILGNTTVLQRYLEDQSFLIRLFFNSGAYVTGLDGVVIASIPASIGRSGANFLSDENSDYLVAALEGNPTIGRPFVGRIIKAPVIPMAVPIRDAQSKVIGALIGVTELTKFNFMSHIFTNRYGNTGGYLLVASKSRLVITASDKSRVMEVLPARGISPTLDRFIEGYEGSAIFINPAGVDVLASAKGIPAAGWYFAAILPTEEAFAPAHDLVRNTLWGAILLTLLAGAVTWWLMRRQLAPLLTTVHNLATLAKSDRLIEPLPIARQDEIGELIGGFNRLLETLGEREQTLRLTRAGVESASDGVFWIAADGRIRDANEAACRTRGRSREAMLNAWVWEIDPTWSQEAWSQHFAELRQRGSLRFEANHARPDGSMIPVEIVANYVKTGGQEFNCAFVRDISERKRLESDLVKNERRLGALLASAPVGVFETDRDGECTFVNQRWLTISGLTLDAAMGRGWASALHPEDRDKVSAEWLASVHELRPFKLEYRFLHPDGKATYVLGQSEAIRSASGDLLGYSGTVTDITERKLIEQQKQQHAARFEAALMSTVRVATSLSEMRDPYTTGHSRRVAEIAVAIGAELGLDAQRQEGLRVAGYLHDIGKITVPTEILAKPGRLEPMEFDLIKEHAQASYDILKGMEFPWPVAEVARQHHERMDGSGYPQGLKGEAILIEARIMSVADVIEAMSSDRPYRPGLGIDKALAEIERGRGSAYDTEAAGAALRLFREKGYAIPA
jgi:PAS domain S-box-containing protein/putative nucleotidyltransferase with HDIG domain